jgi:hypothetical protein
MTTALSIYLQKTADRDKVMGIAQFLPLFLEGPLTAMGKKGLAESLMALGQLADGYRTVTRLSGTIDMTSDHAINATKAVKDPILRKLGALEYVCGFCFFPCEHIALLNHFGVLKNWGKRADDFRPLACFFWYWGLTLRVWTTAYQMLLLFPKVDKRSRDPNTLKINAEFRRLQLTLVKTLSYWVFAMSVFPPGGKAQLMANPGGLFYPLHRLVEVLSPPSIANATNNTIRGALGLTAVVIEIILG